MGLFKKDENDLITAFQKLSDEQKTAFMAAVNQKSESKPDEGKTDETIIVEPDAPKPDEPLPNEAEKPAETAEPPAQNPPDGLPSEPTAQETVAPEAPPVNYVDATTFAEAIKALGDKFDAAIQNLSSMAQKGADMADRLSEEEKKAESGIGYGKLKQGINGNETGVGKTYQQLRKETIGY